MNRHLITALAAIAMFPAVTSRAAEKAMDQMWDGQANASTDQSVVRGQRFKEGKYAMFIHWGLYSQISNIWRGKTYYGIGEWIMNKNMAGIPVAEYQQVAKQFNPVKFDAKAIAQVAKDAGMKYIVITSKHHEGFAMFDSACNDFNIVKATPFGRDPMKELAAACREAGLGFGFYYSHNQDWTFPGGAGGPKTFPDGKPATFADYFEQKARPQVNEITANYGPMEIIWFDTPGSLSRAQTQELVDIVRKNQPNAMISGRIGMGMGDYSTLGDMEVPEKNPGGLWETVDTTNDSWAYAWYDQNWKPTDEILRRVVATAARGGTYMLNIGLRGDGSVPERAAYFLRQAGEWIKRYPMVVYKTEPSPWQHAQPWGDVTVQGNMLYLTVFDWPRDGILYLPGLKSQITAAAVMDGSKRQTQSIKYTQVGGWTKFSVPLERPDSPAAVIAVQLTGKPEADPIHGVDPLMDTTIKALFATVTNAKLLKDSWMEKFGEWKTHHSVSEWDNGGKAVWTFEVLTPGFYRIDLTYKGKGRTEWALDSDEQEHMQNQQNGGHVYPRFPLGILEFKAAGRHTLAVSLLNGDRSATKLEAVHFTPVK